MFSEMKVSTRLALAFGLVLVLLVSVVGLGISRMARVNEGLRAITEENNVEMTHANSMRAAAFQTSVSLRNMMLMSEADKLKAEDVILHQALQQ
jgi:methyl-accepting chemotaxis protein